VYAKLFCKTGQLTRAEYEFSNEATIGRNNTNSIVLHPSIISSEHARIFFDENEKCYFLEDLGSRNGTKLDRMKVTEKEKLGNLHIITFADNLDFFFQVVEKGEIKVKKEISGDTQKTDMEGDFVPVPPGLEGGEKDEKEIGGDTQKTDMEGDFVPMPPGLEGSKIEGPTEAEDQKVEKTIHDEQMIPSPQLPDEMPKTSQIFLLKTKNAANETQTLELKEGENVIGRSPDCDVSIVDSSISQKHAKLTIKSGKVFIKDLGSKNHTFVEKKKIESEVEIQPNTKIRFGTVEAKLLAKKDV